MMSPSVAASWISTLWCPELDLTTEAQAQWKTLCENSKSNSQFLRLCEGSVFPFLLTWFKPSGHFKVTNARGSYNVRWSPLIGWMFSYGQMGIQICLKKSKPRTCLHQFVLSQSTARPLCARGHILSQASIVRHAKYCVIGWRTLTRISGFP